MLYKMIIVCEEHLLVSTCIYWDNPLKINLYKLSNDKPECLDSHMCLLFVYSIYVSFHIIQK